MKETRIEINEKLAVIDGKDIAYPEIKLIIGNQSVRLFASKEQKRKLNVMLKDAYGFYIGQMTTEYDFATVGDNQLIFKLE